MFSVFALVAQINLGLAKPLIYIFFRVVYEGRELLLWPECFYLPQNVYVEILTPDVMVLGGEAFRGD